MHLITGGAFNGKKQWVKQQYNLESGNHFWHSFYKSRTWDGWTEDIVVLEGIERFVRYLIEDKEDADQARKKWQELLGKWLEWEQLDDSHQLVLIGTDITKGIVPANAFDRMLRDAAGWCFQDAAAAADKVEQVWYGIPQTIKEEKK